MIFNPPRVSLLVAMRNEAAYIATCINSLLNQDYPQDLLEVLIYDGQSEDNSRSIAESLIRSRPNFHVVENPKKIQSAAWNLGIEKCKGDIISIVSGHAELSTDYVSRAVETLLRTKADLVGGTVRARNYGLLGEAIAIAISTPFGVGNARFRYTEEEEATDTVFMGFCYKKIYEKIGGYDEELIRNQDDEFSYRLRKGGGKIICNPQIVSFYNNRATLGSLLSQYYKYGYYKVRVLQKHPHQMRMRQYVPPLFVLALFASSLLALVSLSSLSIGIPILYLSTNMIASLHTASKRGWKYFFILPIVFSILHLSYGLGFLAGLFKFWNRWGDKVGKVMQFSPGSTD